MSRPTPSIVSSGAITVRAPAWKMTVAGKDVTREITTMVTSVTYTDHAEGKSDEVELVVEDSNGRWRSAWYPTKGDKVELWIGYDGEGLLPCGRFEIDEVEPAGPPDTVTIRALAAGIIPDLRTRRSASFENQSLRQVAEQVASRHSLTLIGTIADAQIERMTQRDETDLAFLYRVSAQNGYVFSVRDAKLIFYEVRTLDAAPPVVTINRTNVASYRLKDKTHQIYRACEITYDDPTTKKTITRTVTAPGVVNGDVHRINGGRVESEAQALAQATAALAYVNSFETTGTIKVQGEPRLVAGSTLKLAGFGQLSGTYRAEESRHRFTKSEGYTTEAKVKRVA